VFECEHVDRLARAFERADRGDIDAVLLDLGLPDSQGLDTFRKIRQRMPSVPTIVLTGNDDEDLALQAVWAGAQDFLVKGKFDAKLLAHSLRYAIEREGARIESDRRQKVEFEEREVNAMVRLINPQGGAWGQATPAAAEPGDAGAGSAEQDAEEVRRTYADMMELSQQRRTVRDVPARVTEGLRAVAMRMGRRDLGPKDVIELHDATLKAKTQGLPPAKALYYLEEGRRLVLELMGHLVTYYRDKSRGKRV
jgi:DNA-binding NarL/FixJ family response regulator